MVYKKPRRISGLNGFVRAEPDHYRDAVSIELSDNLIVYAKYSHARPFFDKMIWRLDFASTPPNLSAALQRWRCVGFEITACEIGKPLMLSAYARSYEHSGRAEHILTSVACVSALAPAMIPLGYVSVNPLNYVIVN